MADALDKIPKEQYEDDEPELVGVEAGDPRDELVGKSEDELEEDEEAAAGDESSGSEG
jgi:hypothetical protein